MENGYDVIAGIVDDYCHRYSTNELIERFKANGCEIIESKPRVLFVEELAENEQRGRDIMDYLENLRRFEKESRKVEIMVEEQYKHPIFSYVA